MFDACLGQRFLDDVFRASPLLRRQFEGAGQERDFTDTEDLQRGLRLHERLAGQFPAAVADCEADDLFHLVFIELVRLQDLHGIGPQRVEQLLEPGEVDLVEVDLLLGPGAVLVLHERVLHRALPGVVHRRAFLVPGDDAGADAGFRRPGVLDVIVGHVVVADVLLVDLDVGEVHDGIVGGGGLRQVDGGDTLAALLQPESRVSFLTAVDDLVLDLIERLVDIGRALERLGDVFLVGFVGRYIAGVFLCERRDIVAAFGLLDIVCRIAFVVRGNEDVVDAVRRSVAREEGQHTDVPFSVMLEGEEGHFLGDRRPGLPGVVLRGGRVVLVGTGRQQRTVIRVDVRVAVGERHGAGGQIFGRRFDGVGNAEDDDLVGLIVVAGHAVDEVIQRVPGRVRRRGMGVGGRDHRVRLIVLRESAFLQFFQDTGLDALGHVDEFRRHIDLGLPVRLDDERAGIQTHQKALHQIAKRVVTGRDVRDGSGDVRLADTDPHAPALRVRGKGRADDGDDHDEGQQQGDRHFAQLFHSQFPFIFSKIKKAHIQGNRFRVWRLCLTES